MTNRDSTFSRIDSGRDGPSVLLSAGVHGDEHEPVLAALELRQELLHTLKNGMVTVVPVVSESAYRLGSRFGEDGLDLARVCPGDLYGTVTEVAAHRLSKMIEAADYYVDMHTGGLAYGIAPLAGYLLHPSAEVLAKQRRMAFAFNLPIVWGTDATPSGRTLSVARDAGVPAIYLEYGGGTGVRPRVVKAYKEGFLNLLNTLKMVDVPGIVPPVEDRCWVEDYRKDSGYLQGMMPSPIEGIFTSECTLGDFVKAGDRWGVVVDPIAGRRETVLVDFDGLAFLQRTIRKVRKGDTLGGVLPIDKPGKKIIDG